jgi:hypothetical protein
MLCLKRLGRIGILHGIHFHQRMQVYHGERAVFQVIPEFGFGAVLFEEQLCCRCENPGALHGSFTKGM